MGRRRGKRGRFPLFNILGKRVVERFQHVLEKYPDQGAHVYGEAAG